MDEVSNKKDEVVCVLVLSRNEEALGVLSVLKDVPHVVILAGEGRSLAEKVGSGYICTYLPISSIPPPASSRWAPWPCSTCVNAY